MQHVLSNNEGLWTAHAINISHISFNWNLRMCDVNHNFLKHGAWRVHLPMKLLQEAVASRVIYCESKEITSVFDVVFVESQQVSAAPS